MVEYTNQVLSRQKWEIRLHAITAAAIVAIMIFSIIFVMNLFLGDDLQAAIQLFDPILAIGSFILTGSIDYYFKNIKRLEAIEKRLRTILTPIESQLDSTFIGTPQFFRSPTPKWIDFKSGMVYLRNEINEIIEIFSQNQSKEPLVLLCSKSGSGKTNLAYGLSYTLRTKYNEEYSHVYYENPVKRTSKLVSNISANGDLVYYQLEEILQEIVNLLDEAPKSKGKKVFVILDDVHRYYRVITGLGRRLNEYSHRISILLIARTSDLDSISDEWSQRIYEEPTERMKIVDFKLEGYQQALQSITLSYLKFYGISVDSVSDLVQALIDQTSGSLRLLSFILEEIPRTDDNIVASDISSISICDRLDRYISKLESSYISEIQKPLDTRSSSLLKRNFREVVLCLAFFTQMEISVPIDALPILTNTDRDSSMIAVGYLKENGEVVSVNRDTVSLITFDHMSFGRSLIRCHQTPDSLLSSTTFRYQNDYEIRCVTLLNYIQENDIESSLLEILSFGNEENISWNLLIDYLKKAGPNGGAKLVPRLMEKTGAGFFGYLSKLEGLLQSNEVIEEILNSVNLDDVDSGLVESLVFIKDADSRHLLEDKKIVDLIGKRIETAPDDASFLLRGIREHDVLIDNSAIHTSIARAIKNSNYPWNLIKSISESPKLLVSNIIIQSILSQKNRIAVRIRKSDDPGYLLFQIGRCDYLLMDETVSSAICDYIEKSPDPWLLIGIIASLNIGTSSSAIRKSIVSRLINDEPPQTIVHTISKNEALMADEIIQKALANLNTQSFWSSDVLGPISEKLRDSMMSDGFDAAMKFLQTYMEHTNLIDVDNMQWFLKGVSSELMTGMFSDIASRMGGKKFDNPIEILSEYIKNDKVREMLKENFPEFDEKEFEKAVNLPAFKALLSTFLTESGVVPAMLDFTQIMGDAQYTHFEKIAPKYAEIIEMSMNPAQIVIDLRGANVLLSFDCIQEAFRTRAYDISQEIERSNNIDELVAAVLEIDSLKELELITNAIESRKLKKQNSI